MQKGSIKDENITTQKSSAHWNSNSFMHICIIYIALFLLGVSELFIWYNITKNNSEEISSNFKDKDSYSASNSDSNKLLEKRVGDISRKFENEIRKFENKQNKLESKINKLHSKFIELEHNITIISAEDGKKENILKQQYDNALNEIKTLQESMKQTKKDLGLLENNMKEKLQNDIKESEWNQKAVLDKELETIDINYSGKYKALSIEISDIKDSVQKQTVKSSKESMENEIRGITSNRVDILQICVIIILFIYIVIITWKDNSRKGEIKVIRFRVRDKSIPTKKVPMIISFNLACQTSHEDLVRGITDDFDSILIRNSKDIQEIHAKVFMVFIDYNERNIILEGDREPQQIKKETVDYIMKMGGTAVVIYHLHPDSRTLEDSSLYSSKLTSIEFHPTLKQLSSKECVLSIDRQFSEYQRSHIRRICNR